MTVRRLVFPLMVVVLLAGCAEPRANPASTDAAESPGPTWVLEDCSGTVALHVTDFDHLDTLLPLGFFPRDYVNVLDRESQANSGRGVIAVFTVHCAAYDSKDGVGFFAIAPYIQQPSALLDVGSAIVDAHILAAGGTNRTAMRELLGESVPVMVPTTDVSHDVQLGQAALPTGNQTALERATVIESMVAADFTLDTMVVGSLRSPMNPDLHSEEEWRVRFWQPTATGMHVLEFNYAHQSLEIGPVRCEYGGDDRIFTDIFGPGAGAACTPEDLGAAMVDFRLQATAAHHPGAVA